MVAGVVGDPGHLLSLVTHLICYAGKLEGSHWKRRAVRTLVARQSHLTALGKFLKFAKERALQLDEDVEVNDAPVHGVQDRGCVTAAQMSIVSRRSGSGVSRGRHLVVSLRGHRTATLCRVMLR